MAEALEPEAPFNLHIALPLAVIYFFLNSLFLPEGLLYTTLLTPFFLWWLWQYGSIRPFIPFFILTGIYAIIHFCIGVQAIFYVRSWFLSFCAVSFAFFIYYYFLKYKSINNIFRVIAIVNIALLPVAIVSLWIHPLNEYFWYYKPMSPGIPVFPRLKMLTYEASYYSFLYAPLFIYFLLTALLTPGKRAWMFVAAITIPLLFSLSFGTLACLAVTSIFVSAYRFNYLFISKKQVQGLIFFLIAAVALSVLLLFVLPDNPISHRVFNVLRNKDTSISGRTLDAFKLGWWIASEKSYLFGVGFGQIKVIGHQIIINYYKYYDPHPIVRIPNSAAETLALFGISGFIIRFIILFWLFFKTNVVSNLFRTAIFVFLFTYQFSGSFAFSTAELSMWALAFSASFPQFDLIDLHKKRLL